MYAKLLNMPIATLLDSDGTEKYPDLPPGEALYVAAQILNLPNEKLRQKLKSLVEGINEAIAEQESRRKAA